MRGCGKQALSLSRVHCSRHLFDVVARLDRRSSTLRPIGSIAGVSGILDARFRGHDSGKHMMQLPAAGFARVVALARRPKSEGAGNAGCLSHPQPCVQVKKARKQVTTGTPKQSGIPCAMVLRLISCSPRSAGLDSLRRPGFMTAGLDPSVGGPGPHDFAVRPRPALVCTARASIASRATFRDDREAPSVSAGWRDIQLIWLPKKRNIFRSHA